MHRLVMPIRLHEFDPSVFAGTAGVSVGAHNLVAKPAALEGA
jgi:hypothetical protein